MEQTLTKNEAAQILGISTASISNWIRHGYIKEKENLYIENEIRELKRKIDNGEIDRLNKRANKSKSKNKFIPDEYISSEESIDSIYCLVEYIHTNRIKVEQSMFLLALNMFIRSNDIKDSNVDKVFSFEKENFIRHGVFQHIRNWLNSISSGRVNYDNDKVRYLLEYNLPDERDVLGIIYQSILHEGEKSNLGSYYTPREVVEELISKHINKETCALDPCCGTGQFLLTFSDYIEKPQNIYGFDIDETATRIAKTNILLKYNDIDFTPNIFNINTLLIGAGNDLFDAKNDYIEKFDLIATNPPWGAKYEKDVLSAIKYNFKEINTKESFSFFICQAYRFLRKEGVISFVLPESITNVKTHQDIRKFILEKFVITKIHILGKCFKNVLSSVISISMKKDGENIEGIEIIDKNTQYNIIQNRFDKNKNYIFDIYVNNVDSSIFSKMENIKHLTLENNSDWALGIVTGDNKKFIKENMDENFEPIYKGSDVNHFKLKTATNFIEFTPNKFQQIAPEFKYRIGEKLIYKFISSNLVFAYDDEKSLSLNSANILIPEIEGYSVKVVSGFLNSNLYNYYFKKKFNSIKILRGDIEQLPIPIIEEQNKQELEYIVDNIMGDNGVKETLDDYIYKLFKITKEEIDYIEEYLN